MIATGKAGGIGFAFPGPFDYATGVCRITGVEKFESLFGIDIGAALRAHLPGFVAPIRFRNDAEAAIAGEVRYGAGRPYRRVLGVTLGTGIGSAFFEAGLPVLRRTGVPENGWLYAEPACDARADDVFSIRGLTARLRVAGVMADSVKTAADLAQAGDPAAQAVFARFGADLGAFLQPFVAAFGADAVLTLGGIGNAFDLFGPSLLAQLSVPALPGELGVRAPLLGAAELVFQRAQTSGIT